MRGRRIRSLLHRVNVDLTPYSVTIDRRRVVLIDQAGVADLVDVGANIGQWAESVRVNGYRGRLHSYEPLSGAFTRLQQAAAGDPTWTTHRLAVGDKPGTLDLHVSERDVFSSALPMVEGATGEMLTQYVATESVEVTTLDALAADLPGPLGVKMDVQGYEERVIEGGMTALATARFLEVELSLVPIYEGERLYRDMLDLIVGDLGFTLAATEDVFLRPDGRALQVNGLFVR